MLFNEFFEVLAKWDNSKCKYRYCAVADTFSLSAVFSVQGGLSGPSAIYASVQGTAATPGLMRVSS